MSSRLQPILASTRARVRALHEPGVERALHARAEKAAPTRGFVQALRRDGKQDLRTSASLRVIAELKRRSPSAGAIREDLDPVVAARALERAGAHALSVLTEPDFFGGSLEFLTDVRAAVALPLLRKDFVVDALQIVEARAHGADAILLLAVALDDRTLVEFAEEARRWQLDVLLEAHGEAELQRLLDLELPADRTAIGVNARDLQSFHVDLEAGLRLAARVPSTYVVVAESGVRTREQAVRVAECGVDATLCGEGLMRPGDPGARFVELFGSGGP